MSSSKVVVSQAQLEYKLKKGLNDVNYLKVTDKTLDGCGSAFSVFIVSKDFDNVALIERQRMVNKILEDEMKEIHAFTFEKTYTPAQYTKYLKRMEAKKQ